MPLAVQPEFRATLAIRKASSSCCGAKLRVAGDTTQHYECVACDQPCDRVLSEPEEVTLHG